MRRDHIGVFGAVILGGLGARLHHTKVAAAVRTGEDVFQVAIIVRAIDRQRCFMPYPYVGVATPGTQ